MIRARFVLREESAEFTVKGHAGGFSGTDIVCAAVSSAAYMAANTVTEILGVRAEAEAKDGYMFFSCCGSKAAADVIRGLELHVRQLAADHPDKIKIKTEE